MGSEEGRGGEIVIRRAPIIKQQPKDGVKLTGVEFAKSSPTLSPEIRLRKMVERILHIDDQIAVSPDQQALIEHEIEQIIREGLTECPECRGRGEKRISQFPGMKFYCPKCGGLGVIW